MIDAVVKQPVVVCFPFHGDKLGGSHVSAAGLIAGLDQKRFKPLVVIHHANGPVAEYFRKAGIAFEPAPEGSSLERAKLRNLGSVLNTTRTLPSYVSFLKSKQVSIVHTNDGRAHVSWGIAARLAGAKLLWHHRSDNSSIGLRWISPVIANRVACVSKFAGPKPGLISSARKTQVIFSPFDLEKLSGFDRKDSRAMILRETQLDSDTHLLGYVGTLVQRKRPLVFLEALAALKSLAPDKKFAGLFLGAAVDGLETAVQNKALELNVSDQIKMLGYRHPGEPWIAGFDALLVPSVGEPLGRTLVEAMILGTAVIASDAGGNPEAIDNGQTGILVPPDQPLAFAKAYLELCSDQAAKRQLVSQAKITASNRFGAKRHVEAIEELYEQMLSGKK
jgi:glycosyltransferase involved in cell wall biosynthesis